jgi:hypothetical protein
VHNNYYFLKQLSTALEGRLSGSVISECFSQNKNELVLRFETHTKPFFVRANLDPSFSCLSFPEDFHRARKNSIDLFEEIIGRRVLSTLQFRNERSFALILSEGFSLVFKMHGSRSNILIFKGHDVNALFRNNLETDIQITFDSLHREIDFSYQAFVQHLDELPKLYFTFGQTPWKYLENTDFNKKTKDEKWQSVQKLLSILNEPHFYINEYPSNHILFSLVDLGKRIADFGEPIKAINEFFYHKIQTQTFLSEKEKLLSALRSTLLSGQNYLEKTELKLHKIENENPYKKWADLLMANMHEIHAGVETVTLADFENGNSVVIKLKRGLSAQKNAELFYKKSKNQHIEIKHLEESIDQKRNEIAAIKDQISAIEKTADLDQLRTLSGGKKNVITKEKQIPLPYHEVEYKGFRIWIGKNAESNDVLTLKHTYKDDLWLHAKDVAGSHVVIKYQSGKKFPKDVIETAAGLAAFHSKRKNESLCPVTVTPKKFVRKRKGDPAGAVVVEREDVVLVPPSKGIRY